MLALHERVGLFWGRHRTLIWMLHSAWALTAGIVIVWLARERYYLVVWVVAFLALLWTSTLFFSRAAADVAGPPKLAHEVTSYVTRVLYQETLFFLLPFYAHSTVIQSPNIFFLALLGVLAVLSCIDLLFDRWVRTRPVFAMTFFTIVAFAAVNLLLPLLVGLPTRLATPAAMLIAVGVAAPLAFRTAPQGSRGRLWLVAAGVVMLAVPVSVPGLIPPVPLRLARATFGSGIESGTLELTTPFPDRVTAAEAGGSVYVVVQVFAPSALPATIQFEWWRDRELLRVSREVSITAHADGFRVWDAWHPASGSVAPGRYRVVLKTAGRRVFGVARLIVDE